MSSKIFQMPLIISRESEKKRILKADYVSPRERISLEFYNDEIGVIIATSPITKLKKVFCYSDNFGFEEQRFTAYMGEDFNSEIIVNNANGNRIEDIRFYHIGQVLQSQNGYGCGQGTLKNKSVDCIIKELSEYHSEFTKMQALNKLDKTKLLEAYNKLVSSVGLF